MRGVGCWGLTVYLVGAFVVAPLLEELSDTPFDQPHNERPDNRPVMFRAQASQPGTAGMTVSTGGSGSIYTWTSNGTVIPIPGDLAKGAPDFSVWRALNPNYEKIPF